MTNNNTGIDVVGILGGATIALSLVPQVIKTFRTKSASDISYYYQAVYITGCTLTNAYALVEGLWPVYIPCLFEEALIIALTVMKCLYSREERICEGKNEEEKDDTECSEVKKLEEGTADVITQHETMDDKED